MKRISVIQYMALIIVFLSLSMSYIYYMNTGNFNSPIIKFEFSNSISDVNKIFLENYEFKKDVIKGVHDQNMIDYAYMIAYTSFIILMFIRLYKIEKKKIYYLGILFSILAIICDVVENIQMFSILEILVLRIDFSDYIFYLRIFTWIKWISLSLILLIMSFHYFKHKLTGKLFAIISVLPIVTALIIQFVKIKDSELYFSSSVIFGIAIMLFWSFFSVSISRTVSFYKIR